jgi:hypothetical protein
VPVRVDAVAGYAADCPRHRMGCTFVLCLWRTCHLRTCGKPSSTSTRMHARTHTHAHTHTHTHTSLCLILHMPSIPFYFSCVFCTTNLLILKRGRPYYHPQISWSSPTYWTVLQAFVDMCLVYFVVRRILIRVFVDWKFRRRLKWWAAQGYIDAQYRCTGTHCHLGTGPTASYHTPCFEPSAAPFDFSVSGACMKLAMAFRRMLGSRRIGTIRYAAGGKYTARIGAEE